MAGIFRPRFKPLLVVGLVLIWAAGWINTSPAVAQDSDEKSALLKYVEETISTENFKVGLNGLQGALSSDVSLESITLADRRGIWLTISQPRLIWSRSSLLVGKVDVESLSAESISVTRLPDADESAPSAETKPFALPELPVAILLRQLAIDTISIDESVFGVASKIRLAGNLALDTDMLDVDLQVDRLDGAGGSLSLVGDYSSTDERLKLAMKLSEPADGLFVNLVGLENRPPVSLDVAGDGPISNFDMDLAFDVDSRPVLTGELRLAAATGGKSLNARLSGPLASILPEQHRAFFGANSRIQASVLLGDGGDINVKSLTLKTGNVDLKARAKMLSDGFLGALNIDLALLPDGTDKVRMPISGGETLLSALQLNVDYDALRQDGWTASLAASDIEQAGTTIASGSLVASGIVSDVADPQTRHLTFTAKGGLDGLLFADQAAAEAIGRSVTFNSQGAWKAGAPVSLKELALKAKAFQLETEGQLTGLTYDGVTKVNVLDLSAFSSLSDRKLSGKMQLKVDGKTNFLHLGFDLALQGLAQNLSIGSAQADKLLASDLLLSGQVSRTENGIGFKKFRLGNKQFQTAIDGQFASRSSDIKARASIHDLATLSEHADGPLVVGLTAVGVDARHELDVKLGVDSGTLLKRPVDGLVATFTGNLTPGQLTGQLAGGGNLDTRPVSLEGSVVVDLQSKAGLPVFSLKNLDARVGESRLLADLTSPGSGTLTGTIDLRSKDISDVAALALQDATGSVNGSLKLLDTDGLQTASAELTANRFQFGDYRVKTLTFVGSVVDLFGQPRVGATINGKTIGVGTYDIPEVAAKIGTSGDTSSFDLQASLSQFDARLTSTGSVVQTVDQTTVSIATLDATSSLARVALQSPSTIIMSGDRSTISPTTLAIDDGSLMIGGAFGTVLDLDVVLKSLPLNLINALQPGAGATGTLSGEAKVFGEAANPQVSYTLNGEGVSAKQLTGAGIGALGISASGNYADGTVELETFKANNRQSVKLSAAGRIPLSGDGLDVQASGTLPLSLAEQALVDRGTSLTGRVRFDVSVKGSLESPRPTGLVTLENGAVTDPLSNLKLVNIGLVGGLDNNRITISRSSASLSGGGQVTISGSVGLDAGYPANIAINLDKARYTDGQIFNTQLDGALRISGLLLRDPTLAGTINVGRTEITVPESFASGSELLSVKHVHPDRMAAQTLARLRRVTPKARPTSRPSIVRLDLTINADNQIFVRGRGLDAELGGRIKISGPVNNPSPTGRFDLRRGRLIILGQRFDLSEGSITLSGDLDPVLYLLAKTDASGLDAYIRVSGPASDIKVSFYSNPELPEDEVLAQIIFGRALGDLSPSQIVSLAAVAAELAGGSGPGVAEKIRRGTGLDNLDLVEDSDGETAVKAGKYVSDRVYLGVQAGSKSQQATINLDVTKDVTVRGVVAADGKSSIGIFLEKEY
jgi:translocation and assembly module TamB